MSWGGHDAERATKGTRLGTLGRSPFTGLTACFSVSVSPRRPDVAYARRRAAVLLQGHRAATTPRGARAIGARRERGGHSQSQRQPTSAPEHHDGRRHKAAEGGQRPQSSVGAQQRSEGCGRT